MRIISQHHDYYDCVQAQGQDLTCVWLRDLHEIKLWSPTVPRLRTDCCRNQTVVAESKFVGFCGKIYPLLEVYKAATRESVMCYSQDEADAAAERLLDPKMVEKYRKPKYKWYTPGLSYHAHDVKRFFAAATAELNGLFIQYHCPVFVVHIGNCERDENGRVSYGTIVLHGGTGEPVSPRDNSSLLKTLEFYRIFDTQRAFQEIHMYLGGVLGAANPHVPVPDDRTMRDIKGFDDWSFKKPPKKKR